STREVNISNIQTAKAGNYIATYTNPQSCNSTITFTIALLNNTIARDETKSTAEFESSETFKSYPNPSNGILNVVDGQKAGKIQLINMHGKLVKSWSDVNNSTLDLSSVSSGMYWIV